MSFFSSTLPLPVFHFSEKKIRKTGNVTLWSEGHENGPSFNASLCHVLTFAGPRFFDHT
jgi:hypothetical protein